MLLITGRKSFDFAHLLASDLDQRGFQIHILDCAVRFDFTMLFDICSIIGIGEQALHRILVQRAFSPYQILDSAELLQKSSNSVIYFYLAPVKQFLDPDVKLAEAKHLLPIFLRKLNSLKKAGYRLVVAERNYRSEIARDGLAHLTGNADTVWDAASVTPVAEDDDHQYLF